MSDLQQRLSTTKRTLSLLQGWGLSARDMAAILDLPPDTRTRHLSRYAQGGEPLPDHPRVNRRLDYLMRIEEALHTYFPRNPEMRHLWVRRGNRHFSRRSPIAVMMEDGESGLIAVLSQLDCTFAWDLTGSRSEYQEA